MSNTNPIDLATARSLAVRAEVDPRSIYRELKEPGSVRGLAGHRARRVLREAGLLPAAEGHAG